jgi:hypothetical protein
VAGAAAAIALAVLAATSAPGDVPASRAAKLKLKHVTLRIGHRAFPEFRDEVIAKPQVMFRVGDTEYSAKVVDFQPDFAIDMKTRKVSSRSEEPKNPAVRVIVWKNGAPDDTSWAFLNMPPHFTRKSMLAFRLMRIEFEGGRALDAPRDTAAAKPAGAPGGVAHP